MINSAEFSDILRKTLKEQRLSRGFSHEKLSELSGVSRTSISQIESGSRNPSMQNICKIVIAMDMKLSEFVLKMEE